MMCCDFHLCEEPVRKEDNIIVNKAVKYCVRHGREFDESSGSQADLFWWNILSSGDPEDYERIPPTHTTLESTRFFIRGKGKPKPYPLEEED